MTLFPLYLRKETRIERTNFRDFLIPVTAYYRDAEATDLAAVNPWPSRPDRRFKTVMLNCYKWRAVWLPDAITAEA